VRLATALMPRNVALIWQVPPPTTATSTEFELSDFSGTVATETLELLQVDRPATCLLTVPSSRALALALEAP
jgi:hypothetical protein